MLHLKQIIRLLGVLLIFFSLTLLAPLIVEFIFNNGQYFPYLITAGFAIFIGVTLCCFGEKGDIIRIDGFLLVVLSWLIMIIIAAIPFMFFVDNFSYIDSLFEAASGLTTCGAEMITNLDDLPQSILFYHQYLQFLGGMGVIVLAVGVLPFLNNGKSVAGFDAPNEVAQDKLVPKIADTAKILWTIYFILFLLCSMSYFLTGLSVFDSICAAFSTVSTGGFSIHNANLGYYHNNYIAIVAIVFMIVSALSFNLHYKAIANKSFRVYADKLECRMFFYILTIIITVSFIVSLQENLPSLELFKQIVFISVSMLSTAGLKIANIEFGPEFLTITFVLFGLVGGCSGSTAGGIKIKRLLMISFSGLKSLRTLMHPQLISHNNEQVYQNAEMVYGFLSVFVITYVLLLLSLLFIGYDFSAAFAAITACLSNVGASIGAFSSNFAHTTNAAKLILIFAMLAGRLELMVFLVCFMPSFWKNN